MSAQLEDVLARHALVWDDELAEWCCGKTSAFCGWHRRVPDEWLNEAEVAHAAHVAAEVRAWITERLADEELRESVVRSIYGDGLDGAHDIASAALTTIAEHLTNEQEASRD